MFIKFYKYLRILSIDVVLGACAMSYFLAYVMSVRLPLYCLVILGLSVWLIYTCDHLIDALKIKHHAHTPRHLFHQENFTTLSFLWLSVLGCAAWVTFFYLPYKTILTGGIILVASAIYLILVWLFGSARSHIVQKELGVAVIYTCGIFIGPLSFLKGNLSKEIIVLFMQVFMIAFVNLILFALFDYETDYKDGHVSFIQMVGKKNSNLVIGFLMVLYMLITLLACLFFISDFTFLKAEWIMAFMMAVLSWIFYSRENMSNMPLYKGIADGIFFLPLIILIL